MFDYGVDFLHCSLHRSQKSFELCAKNLLSEAHVKFSVTIKDCGHKKEK